MGACSFLGLMRGSLGGEGNLLQQNPRYILHTAGEVKTDVGFLQGTAQIFRQMDSVVLRQNQVANQGLAPQYSIKFLAYAADGQNLAVEKELACGGYSR